MSDLAERFKVVEDDYNDALATLEGVLKHVDETKPAASLRVVILNNVIVALISSLEETLRDMFQEYLTILEESFKNHQWLRSDLQKANLDCAIQLLRDQKMILTSTTQLSWLGISQDVSTVIRAIGCLSKN
jgi:hypothetical protein